MYCNIYIKPSISSDDFIEINGRKKFLTSCPKCNNDRYVRKDTYEKNKFGLCKECSEENKKNSSIYNHRLYSIWEGMIQRCHNPNNKYYFNYGARGITVCDEWKNDAKKFIEWSFLNNYKDDLTIDRINNNENYEPMNCRWVDRFTQMQNTREIKSNNKTGFKNISLNGDLFRVRIVKNGKTIIDKKNFKTLSEAVKFKETINLT